MVLCVSVYPFDPDFSHILVWLSLFSQFPCLKQGWTTPWLCLSSRSPVFWPTPSSAHSPDVTPASQSTAIILRSTSTGNIIPYKNGETGREVAHWGNGETRGHFILFTQYYYWVMQSPCIAHILILSLCHWSACFQKKLLDCSVTGVIIVLYFLIECNFSWCPGIYDIIITVLAYCSVFQ